MATSNHQADLFDQITEHVQQYKSSVRAIAVCGQFERRLAQAERERDLNAGLLKNAQECKDRYAARNRQLLDFIDLVGLTIPLSDYNQPAAGQSEPVAQGICETTQTERFAYSDCECGTYEGNLGPCKTWHSGGDPVRCVYCDHDVACHIALYTHPTPAAHSSESQDAANWRKLMSLVDEQEERKTAKVSFYRRAGLPITATGIPIPGNLLQKNYCVIEYQVARINIHTLSYPTFEECMNCIPG